MTVIPIVIGELGTIPKGLVNGLEDLEITGHVDVAPQPPFFLRQRLCLQSADDSA